MLALVTFICRESLLTIHMYSSGAGLYHGAPTHPVNTTTESYESCNERSQIEDLRSSLNDLQERRRYGAVKLV